MTLPVLLNNPALQALKAMGHKVRPGGEYWQKVEYYEYSPKEIAPLFNTAGFYLDALDRLSDRDALIRNLKLKIERLEGRLARDTTTASGSLTAGARRGGDPSSGHESHPAANGAGT